MHALTSLIALSGLVSSALASPWGPPGGFWGGWGGWGGRNGFTGPFGGPPPNCLTTTSAQYLVDGFASLLTNYSAPFANTILSSNFTDSSDSINFLANKTLGSVTFPSKAAFMAGQGLQPPIPFSVINIDAITCDVVVFRWVSTLGRGIPAQGINIMYASYNATQGQFQIETNYSEFNVGAWEEDIGRTCGVPATPPARRRV